MSGEISDHYAGLHLNDNGYMVLFAAVTSKIKEKWPDMQIELANEPMLVRDHREAGSEVELEENVSVDRGHWNFPFWNDRKAWDIG